MSRHKAQSRSGIPGHSGGRGVVLNVTEELINAAVERDSSHCVIADALRAALPQAQRISVDLQTIRFTDPINERRYVYLTPAAAQVLLVKFDQGIRPEPFNLRLGRPAQIVRSGIGHSSSSSKASAPSRQGRRPPPEKPRVAAVEKTGRPVVLGGRTPPTAALSSTRGRRRTFGLKSLKP